MADVLTPQEAENILLSLWDDEANDGTGEWFKWIGLPPDVSWGAFRVHYGKGSVADADAALNDLCSYPPIAARVAEIKAEQGRGAVH